VLPDEVYVAALALADAGLYGWAAYSILRPFDRSKGAAGDISEAFAELATALKATIPDIPPGFTFSEAVQRSRTLKLRVDWDKVVRALRSYEALRYGGYEAAGADFSEVLKLTKELRRTG
jgi:hypothetical protein